MVELSEADVEFETSRSGGPGGQHVDSRATAVRVRAKIDELPLSEAEQQFIRDHIPPKNRAGDNEIFAENADQRSQHQNKKNALKLLNEEINKAIDAGRQEIEKQKRKQRMKRSKRGGGGGDSDNIKEKKRKQRRSETTDDLLEKAYEEDPDTMDDYLGGSASDED